MPDKKKSILDQIKDAISKREVKGDRRSRVGSGGRTRADKIDEAVNDAQLGRMREGQSTDSSQ